MEEKAEATRISVSGFKGFRDSTQRMETPKEKETENVMEAGRIRNL